ncbi:MAG TPA: transketolase C-terminal domain-containing protein, partial [Dongiaceae bacterium]|nr:transketolase C-terminal domain-containing protein [Dongiaceae bacterium]
GPGVPIQQALTALPLGKGRIVQTGKGVAILAFGTVLANCKEAGKALNASVVDMRFVKPIDEALILELAAQHHLLVTVEENTVHGGAGSAVNELLAQRNLVLPVLNLGIPDIYVDHAKPAEMIEQCGLHAAGIEASIRARLQDLQTGSLSDSHG